MKSIKQVIVGTAALLLLASAVHTFAIEGLKLSLQCSNVVLSCPSIEGEIFIVQYRPTLDPNTPWVTLTSSLPADSGTNLTYFVHSNIVLHPNCASSGPGPMFAASAMILQTPAVRAAARAKRMAQLTNDLALLMPPTVVNRPKRPLLRSNSSTVASAAVSSGASLDGANGPKPPGGGGGGGSGSSGTNTPDMGFYQVVKDGVKILDSSVLLLTNGVLSDTVKIGFEAGNAANDGTGTNILGMIESAVLLVDGDKFAGDGTLGSPLESYYPWHFTVDTAFLENGDHTLQIKVAWQNPDNTDGTMLISADTVIRFPSQCRTKSITHNGNPKLERLASPLILQRRPVPTLIGGLTFTI